MGDARRALEGTFGSDSSPTITPTSVKATLTIVSNFPLFLPSFTNWHSVSCSRRSQLQLHIPHARSMSARLPTELLLRTLELLTPHDYSTSYYKQRRTDLRNCCLVSKTWCAPAQPMLPEVYEVARLEDRVGFSPENLTSATTLRYRRVRLLVITRHFSNDVLDEQLLLACAAVIEVRVLHVGVFSMDLFSKLPSTFRSAFCRENLMTDGLSPL